jgi:SagB-type dehydrogenase family enzyme
VREKEKILRLISAKIYPSGGARYPLEIYLFSLNSEHRKESIIIIFVHSLEILSQENSTKGSIIKKWALAGSMIVITGVFERNIVKYGDRGYRHVLVEAGHIAQNFYLNAAAEDIAISGIGGYVDDDFHKLLDVDGIEESVIYILTTGNI